MSCSHECTDGDHNHHDHDNGHDHDDSPERGAEFSLYKYIDEARLRGLNISNGCSKLSDIFKPWPDRMDRSKYVESDADEEMIIFIPFSGQVRLKSIAVRGGPDANGPSKMKVWINREDVDFDSVGGMEPLQEWDCMVDSDEVVEYQTRLAKFGSVRSLTIYFPENFSGAEQTRIDYLGLKGEFEELKKDPVVTIYELNANPADHPKTLADETIGHSIH